MSATPPPISSIDGGFQGRGVGVVQALQDVLPRWGLEAFAAVTHLGDTVVLIALAILVYLAYDRRDGAFVFGVLLVGFTVTVVAKTWFGLPRPPADLQFVTESGLGFPSGHALGSTVAWGSLAVVMEEVSTARRRALGAGTIVATVSVSRVVIGVHYLVDVVVGVAAGIVILIVAIRWLRDDPLGLFGIAAALAVVAMVLSDTAVESLALLGGSVGALTGWQVVEPEARPYGRLGLLAAGGGGLVLVGALAALEPLAALTFAGAVGLTVCVFLAPIAWDRWHIGRATG